MVEEVPRSTGRYLHWPSVCHTKLPHFKYTAMPKVTLKRRQSSLYRILYIHEHSEKITSEYRFHVVLTFKIISKIDCRPKYIFFCYSVIILQENVDIPAPLQIQSVPQFLHLPRSGTFFFHSQAFQTLF